MIARCVQGGMGDKGQEKWFVFDAKWERVAIVGWLTNARRVHPNLHPATGPDATQSAKLRASPHCSARRKRQHSNSEFFRVPLPGRVSNVVEILWRRSRRIGIWT
jgi:hypothetical protein